MNAILVIAKEDGDCNLITCKTVVIDGKQYLSDVWYTIDDAGNVVESEEREDDQ